MKIDGFGAITSTTSTTRKRSVGGVGGFAELLASAEAGDAAAPATISDVAATAALSNLLALQEISEEDVKRRKLMQQGNNLLDSLEQLRQRLLIGTLPAHTLRELSRELSVQKQMVNDPKMNEIIEEIELRAAVELAKLQQAIELGEK